ncbi:MAG: hypothetical protein WC683_03795 [bacterium]
MRNIFVVILALLLLPSCGGSEGSDPSSPDPSDTTASLIGTWERVAEDCDCIIVSYLKFEEVSGNIYAQHSSDNSIFKDRMIVTENGSEFTFTGDSDNFWNDCVVTYDVECGGTATDGMTTLRLDCEVDHIGCTIDLSKL